MASAIAAPKTQGVVLEMQKTEDGYRVVCCMPDRRIERFEIKDDAFSAFARSLSEGQQLVWNEKFSRAAIEEYIRKTNGQSGFLDRQARTQGIFCAMAMNGIWPWLPR